MHLQKFVSDGDGRVTGICTVRVEWQKQDDNGGGWKMTEIPGSERIHACDLVLLAMGFLGPEQVQMLR
jgi:glutamate synthase (NADPH/NADH)